MNALSEKLRRSFRLFRSAITVMRREPSLLLFPLITTLLTLVVAAFFLVPIVSLLWAADRLGPGSTEAMAQWLSWLGIRIEDGANGSWQLSAFAYGIWAGLYLLSMFLATFFNVAFFHEILAALNGDRVSLWRGFRAAGQRVQSIFLWSLVAGLIGMLIRALEERLSFLGRIVAGFIGLAWSVASVFVIPMLVREPQTQNPFKLLTRSARTLKQTWGEMLTGYVGLQGMNVAVLLVSLGYWAVAGGIAYLTQAPILLLPAAGLWLLALIAYSYLAGVASKVYLGALYLYAVEGAVPENFNREMMDMAWKVKGR